jgi:hypothetical protein
MPKPMIPRKKTLLFVAREMIAGLRKANVIDAKTKKELDKMCLTHPLDTQKKEFLPQKKSYWATKKFKHRILSRKRKYYQKNKERISIYFKDWYEKNKEQYNAQRRERRKLKAKEIKIEKI